MRARLARVTLTPNYAQWRLDGGDWQNTYTTLNNLSLGSHAIDTSRSPATSRPLESVTLSSGQNLALTVLHAARNAQHRADPASGQWRIRRRAVQNTFTTLNNLPLGAHTIDYAPVTDYTAPPSESIARERRRIPSRAATPRSARLRGREKLLRRRRHALHDSRQRRLLYA